MKGKTHSCAMHQRLQCADHDDQTAIGSPDALSWPEINGKVSYKLDWLAPANGFAERDAPSAKDRSRFLLLLKPLS